MRDDHGGGRETVQGLAGKLDFLFAARAAAGRRVSNAHVAEALTAQGCPVVGGYIWKLRHDANANPSADVLSGLADFFDVPAAWWFVDDEGDPQGSLQQVRAMLDEGYGALALRIGTLEPGARAVLLQVLTSLEQPEAPDVHQVPGHEGST